MSEPAVAAASGRVAVDSAAKVGAERLRYADLRNRGRVPGSAAAKAFNSSGRWDYGIPHGTASAEVVHAIALEAELYLATIDGRDDQFI